VWDTTGTLGGREVTLTGFAVRRGAAVDLARLTISCCAADARPSVVRLTGGLDGVAEDTWLRVRGTVRPGSATEATGRVPVMAVSAVEIVPAPTDPYEY
jgi:Predicted membrane protein